MTLTSNPVSPMLDKPDVDQRPGTSDIAWAEHAYQQRREPAHEHPKVPRVLRRRLRPLVAALTIVVLIVGLVVAVRYVGSSPAPVVHRPTSSNTGASPQSTFLPPFTLTPPVLRPFPSLPPTIDMPRQ
jgi:hypothetical protein